VPSSGRPRWRHTRPFWGALLVILGGCEILLSERAPIPLIIHIGLQGLAGYLIPVIIVLLGLLLLFHPVQRTFYSLLAVLLSLGSWITSNLGGFFIGMLLGVIGGSLAFAWRPRVAEEADGGRAPSEPPRRKREASPGLGPILNPRRPDPDSEEPGGQADSRDPSQGSTSRAAAAMLAVAAAPMWLPIPMTAPPGRPDLRVMTSALAMTARSAPSTRSGLTGLLSPAARYQPGPPTSPAPTPTSPAATPSSPAPTPTSPAATPSSPAPTPSSPAPTPSTPTPTPSSPTATSTPTPSPSPRRSSPRVHSRRAKPPGRVVATDQSSLSGGLAVLDGLSYDGVARVRTRTGTEPMLKFTMSSLMLTGDIVLTTYEGGHFYTMKASSLDLSGEVELYTTKISGRLAGIRVTYDPARPPSRLTSDLTLTSVVADQLFASADFAQTVSSNLSMGS
jgi:hypothetical protein